MFRLLLLLTLAAFITTSCTKEITSNLPDMGTHVVVDGNIETGAPPLVLLTRSTKAFGDLNINDIGSFFVHGAEVYVTMDSTITVQLPELCLRDLSFVPDSQKRDLLKSLGILVLDTNAVPNVCVYTLPVGDLITYFNTGTCSFMGQEKHRYDLKIKTNGTTLTAYTTLPEAILADSLSLRELPDARKDSLASVFINITVPNTFGHFIRYWTKRNAEPYYLPQTLGSVFDDKLFLGGHFSLPIERGQASDAKVDQNTEGYFWKGDTVTVKWANIDSRTYDFFYTLENDGGGSPFSSPVKLKTNINGGLGVWAGYSTRYYKIIIPK